MPSGPVLRPSLPCFCSSHCSLRGGRAKPHTIGIGAGKRVPYSIASDPANAGANEKTLHVRPLVVDDKVKEWTTGESTTLLTAASSCAARCASTMRCRVIKRSTGFGNAVHGS